MLSRWPAPRHPGALAAVALLVVTTGPLLDALLGGGLVDTPWALPLAAISGYAVGALCRTALAVALTALGAVALTWANQVQDPGAYPVLDDLLFFTVVVGAPALAGATVAAWTSQIRGLREVSRLLRAQQAAEVRAARIEEQNRVESRVQREIIQRMGAIVMLAGGAGAAASVEQVRRTLDTIESTAREALQATREAVGVLREPTAGAPEPRPSRGPAPVVGTEEPPESGHTVGATDLLVGACGVLVAIEAVVSDASRGPAWANVVLGLAAGVPLVVRRRWPVGSAATMLAVLAVMSTRLTPATDMVTVLFPVLLGAYALGTYAALRRRVAGLAVLWAGVLGVALASPPDSRDPDGLVPSLLWVTLGVAAGTVTAMRAKRAARLRRLVAELERGRDAEVRLAIAEQRHRIARDLHDCVAHAMTVVCLHAAAGQQVSADREALQRTLDLVVATSRDGMAELRRGLDEYDVVGADDQGLDLDRLTTNARLAGQEVETTVVGDPAQVPAETGHLAARVVREALVNAARHAPGAPVHVRVVHEDAALFVEVIDQGAAPGGFTDGAGTGLTMLAEWVREQGGLLEHGPGDRGYRVAARLPVARTVPA